MSEQLINANFALSWGLNIKQAILYSYLVNERYTWKIESHESLDFRVVDKETLLSHTKSVYKSQKGLQGALLKMQELNLMRIGKDKERYAVCLNEDLLYQWRLAHSSLNSNKD